MNTSSPRKAFRVVAGLGAAALLLGHAASARQSAPSPRQVKRSVPPASSAGGLALPGFRGAAAQSRASENEGSVVIMDPDLNQKTGISRGRDVVYTEGDMRFTGLVAAYNTRTKQLDTEGSLNLDDPKHHVSGDRAHVDRHKQLATIRGSVVITLKPTPPDPAAPQSDSTKQRQYPVVITCDRADDSYKKEFIVLTGHLVFKQTIRQDDGNMVERTMTADHAEFDGKANRLHLFQPVKAHDSAGQSIDFEKDVFVGTKEGEETLTSPGRSTLKFIPDDATVDDAAAGSKTPPPGPPKQR